MRKNPSYLISFTLLFFCSISYGQNTSAPTKKLLTTKYAGIYRYGTDKSRNGEIIIYPETDTSLLFYIELSRGTPSYNQGMLDGRVIVRNDTGTFYSSDFYSSSDKKGCKWAFKFSGKKLTISTIDDNYECGFGYAVFADGIFKRSSSAVPESYIGMEGDTIYFNKALKK